MLLLSLKCFGAKTKASIIEGSTVLGEKDFLKGTIEKIGGEILFGRVLMKPGKPTTFAKVKLDGHICLIFSLPGMSVSIFFLKFQFVFLQQLMF